MPKIDKPQNNVESNAQKSPQNGSQFHLPAHFDSETMEKVLVERWLDAGCYERTVGQASPSHPIVQDCTVVIPPPNVTGVLHMGHALDDTIQDTFVRFNRMLGKSVRWIMGLDHAGISTQAKVDKKLKAEGISRLEIGREKFVEACWDWTREYGGTIVRQMKRMGASCDYSDQRFTMDKEFSYAVRKVFCDWYHAGLIYRGKRIVNWCPSCRTAISDDEAEYQPQKGHLWYLRYPLKEPIAGQSYITVATTRPETMLGDTGVAVSPDDPDKAAFVGATVVLPLVKREIPIFSDWHVNADFGTGFVKVTPAHDPNDFAMGEAHDLEGINVLDETAHILEGYGVFSGLSREEAREAIVSAFDTEGLLDHVEELDHSVMHCYRCDTALEPWLSEQWFVRTKSLKPSAIEAVRTRSIHFHPERWEDTYLTWMENLKDWCISRQLWWGHRIPVFTCEDCGWEDACMDDIAVCPSCGSTHVVQDPDVLDTWFSSQLFPYATQGWPLHPESLEHHYPTTALFTARDIIALWVARMVMSSYSFLDQKPFHDVFIHATILAKDGSRMSKSKGNGVDPMDLIKKYGADAMRFNLLSLVTGNQDVKFDAIFDKKTGAFIESPRTAAAKAFVTKIWNACRFALMNLEGYQPGEAVAKTPEDKWMLSRLASLVQQTTDNLSQFEFGTYARDMQSFFWNEVCDWYVELTKARLQSTDEETRKVAQRNLIFVLDTALRLLHPVMPFITETIWERLPASALDIFDERAERMDARPISSLGAWTDAGKATKEETVAQAAKTPKVAHAAKAAEATDVRTEELLGSHAKRFLMQAPWPRFDDFKAFVDKDSEETFDVARRLIAGVRSVRSRYRLSPNLGVSVVIRATPEVIETLSEQDTFIRTVGKIAKLDALPHDAEKPQDSVAFEDKAFTAYVVLKDIVDFEQERTHVQKALREAEDELKGVQKTLSNEGFLTKAEPEVVQKKRERHEELEATIERLREELANL